ncbi:GntR family transcriptional regulator [Saccharomonospora sp. NPDC046836]|uniref:GntR family transcriptional regulator n=1 Tax=Saccharomonospora sp. NPDC046836 TaxID=3156921 RepID=UPI0033D8440C
MNSENVDGVSVADHVYTTLRDAIRTGRYAPGERLTSVRLAEELGVSRTPVRAALTQLKSEGLVDSADGRAAYIPTLTVEAVEEAYEITGALESMLIERVARTATDEDLGELAAAVSTMEEAARAGDQAAWAAADERFHTLVREIAGRDLAASMLARVDAVIDRVRFLTLNLHPQGAEVSAREHRDVLDAMIAREPETAQRRHERHLQRVRVETVTFLTQSFPSFGGTPFAGRSSPGTATVP